MKNILSAFSLIAIFVASLYDNNYLVRPNKIVWSDSLNLSWSNFGGLELSGKNYELQTVLGQREHISFLAVTETDIIYSKNSNTYDVQAVFYTGRSFYKIYSDTVNPSSYSLKHELYHFHLTELFARYIRRDLARLQQPSSHQADSIYAKHLTKLDSASAAYDKFTRHANIVANQKQAERMFDSLLISTANYKRRNIE